MSSRSIVRRELPADEEAARAVHLAAFARADGVPAHEARILQRLRDDGDLLPRLCWVADVDGRVVGHVATSRSWVEDDDRPVVALGPLGVLPEHQGRDLGSALVHVVLAAADVLDVHAVVLLGDSAFYGRFGFEAAADAGVASPVPQWGRSFQIRRLTAWDGTAVGRFRYAAAFDPL